MTENVFGRTVGGNICSNRNSIFGSKYTLSYVGKVVPRSIHAITVAGGSGSNDWRCAIYDSAYNLVAITEERRISDGWHTFNIITPDVILTGPAEYFLCSWSNNISDGGRPRCHWEPATTTIYHDRTYDGNDFPDILVESSSTSRNNTIYCTYDIIKRSGRRKA